jgi:hypothetical protein
MGDAEKGTDLFFDAEKGTDLFFWLMARSNG